MNEQANWFHVFNATSGKWLQGDEESWGDYEGVAEFMDREGAEAIGKRQRLRGHTVIVLGDFGSVE